MNMKLDWFSLFKMEVMSLSASFQEVKKEVVVMIATNEWILEDIDLSRSFQNLQKMMSESETDLDELVKEINHIEDSSVSFDVEDLEDELNFIHENVRLEHEYVSHMVDYMEAVSGPIVSLPDLDACDKVCKKYPSKDRELLQNMKQNHHLVKLLREERRENSFE